MGVYTNGRGAAFSTTMKLFHTGSKSFLPAQAHRLVVSFWVGFHRCKGFQMFQPRLLHDAHSNGLSWLCLGELLFYFSHFLSRELSLRTSLGGHPKLLWWCENGFLIIGFRCSQKETFLSDVLHQLSLGSRTYCLLQLHPLWTFDSLSLWLELLLVFNSEFWSLIICYLRYRWFTEICYKNKF